MRSNVHIYIHLVWTTKYRAPLLTPDVRKELFPFLHERVSGMGSVLRKVNSVEDHIHCLITHYPDKALMDIVKDMKGASSFHLNRHLGFNGDFGWQDTYAAFSVSPLLLKKVENYIARQEEHHKSISLDEEMRWFRKMTDGI